MNKDQWERIVDIANEGKSSLEAIDPQTVDTGFLLFGGKAAAGSGSEVAVFGDASDLMHHLILQLMSDPFLELLLHSSIVNSAIKMKVDTCDCEHCVSRRGRYAQLKQTLLDFMAAKKDQSPIVMLDQWIEIKNNKKPR